MLCYVFMLCYVMSCRVTSRRVASRRAVPCRVISCRVVSCRAVPCRAVPCRAVPCCSVPCYVMLCFVMLCYVVLCYVMLQLHLRHDFYNIIFKIKHKFLISSVSVKIFLSCLDVQYFFNPVISFFPFYTLRVGTATLIGLRWMLTVEFKLPPRSRWELRFSGPLRSE